MSVYFQSAVLQIFSCKEAISTFITTPAAHNIFIKALADFSSSYLKFCGGRGCWSILRLPEVHPHNAVKCDLDCAMKELMLCGAN